MRYVRVKWLHDWPDYPTLLYSELDPELWEIRRLEIYADGRMDYANQEERSGTTKLGIEPFPLLEQIAADPEFEPSDISAQEFECLCEQARAK